MKDAGRVAGWVTISLMTGTACGTRPTDDAQPATDEVVRRTAAREQVTRPLPEPVTELTSAPVTGEVPEKLLRRIREDLAQRAGIDPAAPALVRAEAVTWADGSLGCPRPGQFYTQALVPGYWIVFSHGGREYDYRASTRGYFLLCETGGSPPLPPGDHDLR